MITKEELVRRKKRSLIALQELLIDSNTNRPSMIGEISKIDEALRQVEGVDKKSHVKKSQEIELIVDDFIMKAENDALNPKNMDRLNRLNNIKKALDVYRNAYAVLGRFQYDEMWTKGHDHNTLSNPLHVRKELFSQID